MELERLKEEVGQLDERRRSLEMECEEGRGRVGGVEAELSKARDEIKLLQKQVHHQFIVLSLLHKKLWKNVTHSLKFRSRNLLRYSYKHFTDKTLAVFLLSNGLCP